MVVTCVSVLRPEQNGQCFADNIFKSICFKEKFCILSEIWLEIINSPIYNMSSYVQVIAWQWQGIMMTSSNRNIFRVTGPLCGEFTGHQWIPLTKASDAELWCFPWSAREKKSRVNVRDASDLRRHRAYYDVTPMLPKMKMPLVTDAYMRHQASRSLLFGTSRRD